MTTTTDIRERLNQLSELQAQRDLLDIDFQQKRESILAPVAQQIADLEAELEPLVDALNRQINALTAEIETAVICEGESVKGERLQAVFAKGRVTWDSRALVGYAAAHPEIERFRKTGEPSVTIRAFGH
jgi:hypothetical protein